MLLIHFFAFALTATPVEVSIVGTADLHGRLAQLPLLGGYLDNLRAARPGGVLLVDGGDLFQGTLESDANEGETVVRAYAALGYDAAAIGNHEFDFGPVGPKSAAEEKDDPRGALRARTKQAPFPFLAANLQENGAPLVWPNVKPSTLVTLKNGLRIGIIGVTTKDTPTTTSTANFVHLSVTPVVDAIVTQAKSLRSQGAQIIVVAAHAGGRCEHFENATDVSSCDAKAEIFEVAQALPPGTVDVIVGGHVHAGIAHEVNGVAIIEAFAQGQAIGRVDVTYDPTTKKIVQKKIHAPERLKAGATYEGRPVTENAAIAALIAPAIADAETRRKQKLGAELDAAFERSYSAESQLGNFVTSMMLKAEPRAKIAITNGGGLRANLPAGALDYGSLYNALPFDNRLALVQMDGRTLRTIFKSNLAAKNGVLSIAGATVTARCGPTGLDVDLRWSSGAAIGDDEKVMIVTNDFLATGGEGFTGGAIVEQGSVIREAIVAQLKRKPEHYRPSDWYDASKPRIQLPGARPVLCKDQR